MKPYAVAIFSLLLGGCVGSPLVTQNQTAEEVAADIASFSTGRLCEGLAKTTSGQCFADREVNFGAYTGYCSKIEAAIEIELVRRGESCPGIEEEGVVASTGTIRLQASNEALSGPANNSSDNPESTLWAQDVIASLSKFEEFDSADQLSWKEMSQEPKGRYETEAEYQSRISSAIDNTKIFVYAKTATNSVVTDKDNMQDYVLFEFSPFLEYEIGSDLSNSFYEGQNAFGATRIISVTTGEKVHLSPISKEVYWRRLTAIQNGWTERAFLSTTHEKIPLIRSQLIESDAEIVVIRIFSVEANNPQTYTVSTERASPTIDSPIEKDILIRKVRASLEYAGLYDEKNKQFVAVFSPDLRSLFIVNGSMEVDLTSIPADLPFEWRY